MAASEMPFADATVTERVLGLAPGRNGRPALVDDASGVVISYSRLAVTVRAAAAGLVRRGMRLGDVAGVHVASAAKFVLASQAIRAAGGAPSPICPGACPRAAAIQLTDCDARILITDSCLASASVDIAERSRVRQVVCFGKASETVPFDALLGTGTMRPLHCTGDDLALIAVVPGPDGRPGLVRVTHRELAAQLRGLASQAKLAAWDIIVTGPPHGDGRGYSALLDLALVDGATIVGAPSTSGQDLLAMARIRRGTVAFVPPGTELADHNLRLITISP
jgi:acyl-coenzyme A synthetase/AMP-(fatty) acid ligase